MRPPFILRLGSQSAHIRADFVDKLDRYRRVLQSNAADWKQSLRSLDGQQLRKSRPSGCFSPNEPIVKTTGGGGIRQLHKRSSLMIRPDRISLRKHTDDQTVSVFLRAEQLTRLWQWHNGRCLRATDETFQVRDF
jgi:hypothetical protein